MKLKNLLSIFFVIAVLNNIFESFSMYRAAQVLTRMGKQYVKQVTVPVKSDQITVGNTTIKLYQGDILNLPFAVDAIVNPANSRLAPLGGLSKKYLMLLEQKNCKMR